MGKQSYDDAQNEIYASLTIMRSAEEDWEGLPHSVRSLDESGMQWIAAALASEGISKR